MRNGRKLLHNFGRSWTVNTKLDKSKKVKDTVPESELASNQNYLMKQKDPNNFALLVEMCPLNSWVISHNALEKVFNFNIIWCVKWV